MVRRKEDGQVLVFFLFGVLSLTMLWMMVLNIGKMIKDRIVLQNAADCAAQTSACIRARALNMIGALNAELGVPILSLGTPEFVWWVCPEPHFWVACDHTAMLAKVAVEKIIETQEGINSAYGGGWAYLKALEVAKRQELNSKGEPTGAEGITSLDSFSLGLHRNQGDIQYWGTIWVESPKYVGPLPTPPVIKGIEVKNTKRWYEQDKNFHKKKQRIIAFKRNNSTPGGPYLLGKKLFGIKEIPSISCIAASRPYNAIGPMFPTKGKETGLSAAEEYLPFLQKEKGWDAQLIPVGAPYEH